MRRLLGLLALPLVAVGGLIARAFGMHFCAEEAAVVAGAVVALPVVGPYVKSRFFCKEKPQHDHSSCC